MLLVVLLCLCLPPSLVADIKACKLGDPRGVPNASCAQATTCAIYDGIDAKCIGWTTSNCATREFRNLRSCECHECPVGTGQNCTPDNQCCSIADCGTTRTSTPTPTAKPFALSSTSRLAPHAAMHVLLPLWLLFLTSKFHTHRF